MGEPQESGDATGGDESSASDGRAACCTAAAAAARQVFAHLILQSADAFIASLHLVVELPLHLLRAAQITHDGASQVSQLPRQILLQGRKTLVNIYRRRLGRLILWVDGGQSSCSFDPWQRKASVKLPMPSAAVLALVARTSSAPLESSRLP